MAKRPQRYADLDEDQYRRCLIRERIIALVNTDFGGLIKYLRNEEDYIRHSGFDTISKQEIRCPLYKASFNPRCTDADLEMFDRIFGHYIPPRQRMTNESIQKYERYHERTRTPEEEVDYRISCTYEVFYNWIVSGECQKTIRELNDYGRERLKEGVEIAIMNENQISKTRTYEEGDRERMYQVLKGYGI